MGLMKPLVWREVELHISNIEGLSFHGFWGDRLSGCTSSAHKLTDGTRTYFVKIEPEHRFDLLSSEAHGLELLAQAPRPRVPKIIGLDKARGYGFLVLEWIDLHGEGDWRAFGRNLAALHQLRGPAYGLDRDNMIGSSRQSNRWCAGWFEFFWNHRLLPQLEWAYAHGFPHALHEPLARAVKQLLQDYHPPPALLHGDLWSGNAAFDDEGEAVIFDPAVYYGDPEADLAMTRLFGSFPQDFYNAYHQCLPKLSLKLQRETLYNLYHILNHFNIFGEAYADQAEKMCQSLIQS